MKPPVSMAALRGLWHQLFPRRLRRRLLGRIEKGRGQSRRRTIQRWGLVRAVMMAFIRHLPGQRAIGEGCRQTLTGGQPCGAIGPSTLSAALRHRAALAFARGLFEALPGSDRPPEAGELIAVDSTGVTAPASRQHGCALLNSKTAGMGALWGFRVAAPRGANPVQVFHISHGAWSDAKLIGSAPLAANGPVYLLDRGFYRIEQVADWIEQGVRFVQRVSGQPQFTALDKVSDYKGDGKKLRVVFDGLVELGSPRRRGSRPVVRLIRAWTPTTGWLILATSELDWSAARVLEAYRARWQVERYHLYLKENQCLAHLYSFQANGLEFLLWCSLLLTATLFLLMGSAGGGGLSVDCMRQALAAVRRSLGLWHPWRPNTARKHYKGRNSKQNRQALPPKPPPPNATPGLSFP